jgi:hypothetical protein
MFLTFALLAAAQTSAPAPASEAEKKICKQVQYTGSILRKRECRTKSEWAAIAERNRQNSERMSQQSDSGY